jgi:hypothetical protein
MSPISTDQAARFEKDGYLVFERFFDDEECRRYKADIDAVEARRKQGERIGQPLEFPHLGPLICHERIMRLVEGILGSGFCFHHLHAVRQEAGTSGVPWHQDYEQVPQSNRSHIMVHLFYYFNGLNGEIGDLLVLPGSQNRVVNNDALWHLGTADLPGTVVINNLPAGSVALVHSALWHARRAKPGGENLPRYFADASYCQAGIRWPAAGSRAWKEILAKARERGLDGHGKYPALLDESRYFDAVEAAQAVRSISGSAALHLREWKESV